MSKKKFWVLCVSKMPRTKNVKIKIFCSEDVPAKGEELTILGHFESKKRAELVRGQFSDKQIIANWRNRSHIDYSSIYPDFR